MRAVLRTVGTLTAAASIAAVLTSAAQAASIPVAQAAVSQDAPSAGDWVATARWNNSYQIFRGQGETLDRAKDNALYSCHAYHPYTRTDCRIVDFHRVS